MSRYTFLSKHNRKHEVAFGHDHALGYFYDVFDNENEKVIEEKSDRFSGLTGLQLFEAISRHASDMTLQRFDSQIAMMKLDNMF